jgi:hypothetical protein
MFNLFSRLFSSAPPVDPIPVLAPEPTPDFMKVFIAGVEIKHIRESRLNQSVDGSDPRLVIRAITDPELVAFDVDNKFVVPLPQIAKVTYIHKSGGVNTRISATCKTEDISILNFYPVDSVCTTHFSIPLSKDMSFETSPCW